MFLTAALIQLSSYCYCFEQCPVLISEDNLIPLKSLSMDLLLLCGPQASNESLSFKTQGMQKITSSIIFLMTNLFIRKKMIFSLSDLKTTKIYNLKLIMFNPSKYHIDSNDYPIWYSNEISWKEVE